MCRGATITCSQADPRARALSACSMDAADSSTVSQDEIVQEQLEMEDASTITSSSGSSSSSSDVDVKPLDNACFQSFAEFIRDCQAYARFSGCRFSIKAFEGIDCEPGTCLPVVSDERANDDGPLLSAKLQAARSVRRFTERLRSNETGLIQDLSRAFDMVIKESARNSMIATCKAAELFPPSPAPAGVEPDDCSWDEVGSAPAVVIAQRLYNDEVHRLLDVVDGRNMTLVRAKTASFIVEFADEVGVPIPQMSAERSQLLARFTEDVVSWSNEPQQPERRSPSQQTSLDAASPLVGLAVGAGAIAIGAIGVAACLAVGSRGGSRRIAQAAVSAASRSRGSHRNIRA